MKSMEYIDVLDIGNPPVPLIFSLIIHARIPLSAAADVRIYAHAAGLPIVLSADLLVDVNVALQVDD